MKDKNYDKYLEVNGVKYELVVPFKQISEDPPISVGPHYDSVPADKDYVFMPDLEYCVGLKDTPWVMHPIQRYFQKS